MRTPRAVGFNAGCNPRREAGMSLVEMMVGMLIGLIGIVIITHLYVTNEQYKRSTMGAAGAQVNGAIALYTIERDTRMAGFGFNHSGALGCTCAGVCSPLQYYYSGTYGAANATRPPLTFAPVVISSTAGSPDSITILYSTGAERALPGTLSETMPLATSDFKLDGLAGFHPLDFLVVANGATCMLAQATLVTAGASTVSHATTSLWNPGGATMPAFPAASYVFNLGTPAWRTYSISNNKLQVADVLGVIAGGTALDIMDDIVDMQAQYGKDTDTNGVVDAWNTTAPTNAAEWQQVLAIRVAVLARSDNYERPGVAGAACEATTAAPTWSGFQESAAAGDAFNVPGGIPSCYKYRVFETIIPLRNMIWRPI